MKFGILVNEGPFTHQASDTAYQFTNAALEADMKSSVCSSTTTALTTRQVWRYPRMTTV